ncbi:Gfo/Idh/MocA family oxidoreductase [Candidatus Woesearchaeota archaeon]|jgi:UDP-N-acetyl-2-amino-2-deoxyglucuronate dehydrogenase|nr:Gfo/Idh/MocA family oxidoreductase [Candidatus Woesearchaeota archaeon]MBT4368406.1 Gfo/Idh/MocA family oxidoreductase [Candidatus Woesearchaeota archaeon]MBT4712895.1 Gfo/Idh/MocA family oxidoreductase [Candidatus Woesearchaeota archaeon]MBT6639807.1 Gfo/Idh/MocA family oxidoreductase [Candidatus Woesearchaeota archaeon]MBT7133979.1 Gfo/Idh/MocA family oxidoreductase [Candidatus Woesearchaeota archaeon]
MNEPIRFGAIGGGMATYLQAKSCIENKSLAQLIAVHDTCELAMQGLYAGLQRVDPSLTLDLNSTLSGFLARDDLDFVCINTPPFAKLPLVKAVAGAGHNVVVEKPFARTLAEAYEMMHVCDEADVSLDVISQHRFDPDVQRARDIISHPDFGEVTYAELGSYWSRCQDYFDQADWRGTWQGEGGGVLMNQAVHGMDVLAYLLGGFDLVTASASARDHDIEVEDCVSAEGRFLTGADFDVSATTNCHEGDAECLTFVGEQGQLMLRNYQFIEGSGLYAGPTIEPALARNGVVADASGHGGHFRQLELIGRGVRGEHAERVTGADALITLRNTMMIYYSTMNGSEVVEGVNSKFKPDAESMCSYLK